jgi:hypothetical protein
MVSQTACLAPPSDEIVDRMNSMLSKIGSQRQLREIVARIQEPYLTDTVRSALEREMQRVTRLQALAEGVAAVEAELAMVAKDMKPAPDRLDRPEWKLPEPVTTEAGLIALRDRVQRDLASACVGSIEQLQSRFIDERTGILPLLR